MRVMGINHYLSSQFYFIDGPKINKILKDFNRIDKVSFILYLQFILENLQDSEISALLCCWLGRNRFAKVPSRKNIFFSNKILFPVPTQMRKFLTIISALIRRATIITSRTASNVSSQSDFISKTVSFIKWIINF